MVDINNAERAVRRIWKCKFTITVHLSERPVKWYDLLLHATPKSRQLKSHRIQLAIYLLYRRVDLIALGPIPIISKLLVLNIHSFNK